MSEFDGTHYAQSEGWSYGAAVHRDCSIHTENVPVRIEMYSDRMEIISGGLYGK